MSTPFDPAGPDVIERLFDAFFGEGCRPFTSEFADIHTEAALYRVCLNCGWRTGAATAQVKECPACEQVTRHRLTASAPR